MKSKERFIPAGSKPKTVKGADAIAYVKDLSAIAYKGKSTKKEFYFRFTSKERLDDHLKAFFDKCKKETKEKSDKEKAAKAFVHSLKVGDIVYDSWGWEQTNIDFYEVTAVPSGKSVKVRKLESITTEHNLGAMSGYTVPCPGKFVKDAPELLKRVKLGYRDQLIIGSSSNWSSSGSCYVWEGKPMGCSWYA